MLLAQVNIKDVFDPAVKFGSVTDLSNLVVRFVSLAAALLIFATLIYAGYLYINSDGEKEKLQKANAALLNAIIGLVIIVTAYWVIQIIARFTGWTF